METHTQRRFGGIARLYGEHGLHALQQAHVCVVGVGGVGSWAVEALARSSIGKLTLIDLDNIAESNVNRQIHALTPDFGKAKVTALRERIAQINPDCQVVEIEDFVDEDNLAEIFRLLCGAAQTWAICGGVICSREYTQGTRILPVRGKPCFLRSV